MMSQSLQSQILAMKTEICSIHFNLVKKKKKGISCKDLCLQLLPMNFPLGHKYDQL